MNAEDTTNLLHLAIQNTVSAAFRPYLGIDDHQSTPSQAAPRDSRGFRGPGDPRAPVPNPKGEELMVGSDFGSVGFLGNSQNPRVDPLHCSILQPPINMPPSR